MIFTPPIIGWASVLLLFCYGLLRMCLTEKEPPPFAWVVPVGAMWALVFLIRAICQAPLP